MKYRKLEMDVRFRKIKCWEGFVIFVGWSILFFGR